MCMPEASGTRRSTCEEEEEEDEVASGQNFEGEISCLTGSFN